MNVIITGQGKMRPFQKYLIALGVAGLWAAFSYAYVGVEDGSSGLSLLGWVHAVFFLPGGLLLQAVKGSHSNADLPLMAAFSLCVYMVVAVLAVMGVGLLRRAVSLGKARQQGHEMKA
jgi:hypothetical protein